jgi:hypothetical protein
MAKRVSESASDAAVVDDLPLLFSGRALRTFFVLATLCMAPVSGLALPRPAGLPAPRQGISGVPWRFSPTETPAGTVEADLDGDGVPDIAKVSRRPLEISIRLSLAPARRLPLLEPALAIAAVDFDRDGDRDLVVFSIRAHVFVWLNDGGGAFSMRPGSRSDLRASILRLAPESVELFSSSSAFSDGCVALELRQDYCHHAIAAAMSSQFAYRAAFPRAPPPPPFRNWFF